MRIVVDSGREKKSSLLGISRWNFGNHGRWSGRAYRCRKVTHLTMNYTQWKVFKFPPFLSQCFDGLESCGSILINILVTMGAVLGAKRRASKRDEYDTRATQLAAAEMAIKMANEKTNDEFTKEYIKPE